MSDLDTQVIDFITRVVSAMGLDVTAETAETPDHVRINLTGDWRRGVGAPQGRGARRAAGHRQHARFAAMRAAIGTT